jgi:cobalt-zinc-cadmium efflux system membrane fusion protein
MKAKEMNSPAIAALTLSVALLGACGDNTPAPTAPPAVSAATPRDPLLVPANAELAGRITLGEVGIAQVRETLQVPGRIEVDETRMARIGSPVTGRISDLVATVGQNVRRGQVLATINSTELSTAQLGFLRAISQRQAAGRASARAQQLFEADVIGSAEAQRRQSELALAQVEEQATRDQLKVLGMSEAAIEQLAASRTINSLATITASVSGTVIERKVTEGQVVQPADTVFLVADLSHVWVVADIPEQNAGLIRQGEAVTVQIAALPGRELPGTLAFVSPVVSPETRTVRARMDLANPSREFKPAMLASVMIRGKPAAKPVIPIGALVREDNRDYLFVATARDVYRLRAVSLGAEQEGTRVLLDGVRAGESVVLDGAFHLNNERKRRELDGN